MTKMTGAGRAILARLNTTEARENMVYIVVGGITFYGSFNHVYHLAEKHGQSGFNALSVAGTIEILAAYAGVEMKRRKGMSKTIPMITLLGAVAFIMWANYMSAPTKDSTSIIIAMTPAAAFLALMAVVETRKIHRPRKRATAAPQTAPPAAPAPKPKAKPARTREEVRDEWFLRRTSADPMTDDEIAALLGIGRKSAGDARRRWAAKLVTEVAE